MQGGSTIGMVAGDARRSLGAQLDAHGGIGPGFDHLRVGLSLAILFWHCFGVSYGIDWVRSSPAVAQVRPLIATMLPAFFALSGFLVMGSAQRVNDLRTFLVFRVLRIVPALATEISLSALVLGPLITVVPLAVYFSDPLFVEYFGSLIGRVSYVLPGLFMNTPTPGVVNGALWTVGPEICCYVLMAAMMITAIYRSTRATLLLAAAYVAACVLSDIVLPPWMYEVLPTKALVLAFLAGAILHQLRHRLRWSPWLAALAFVAALALIALAQAQPWAIVAIYPAAALIAYVTVVIGLSSLPPLPFFHRGDYSYGIYIFGFPIQQSVTSFLPPEMRLWWINLAIALPITLLFAVTSWHLVEKPCLGLRKRVPARRSPPARSPAAWGKRQRWQFAAILLYGLFVVYQADVFPLKRVVAYLGHAKAAERTVPSAGI